MDTNLTPDASTIGAIYNEYGDYYHESRKDGHGRFTNDYLDLPTLVSLLDDDLTDLRVLDAGCGSGLISYMLAIRGAHVEGVDASEKMIEIANANKPPNAQINFQVGDIANLDVSSEIFDLIVCNYVLENVHDIATVFREFKRVMKTSGRCIFSISHPLRALSSKQNDDDKQVWVLRDYFDHSMRQSDFGGGMVVPKYKRTIGDYAQASYNAGFVIRRLIEPQPSPSGEPADPTLFETSSRLPQLLTVELVSADR